MPKSGNERFVSRSPVQLLHQILKLFPPFHCNLTLVTIVLRIQHQVVDVHFDVSKAGWISFNFFSADDSSWKLAVGRNQFYFVWGRLVHCGEAIIVRADYANVRLKDQFGVKWFFDEVVANHPGPVDVFGCSHIKVVCSNQCWVYLVFLTTNKNSSKNGLPYVQVKRMIWGTFCDQKVLWTPVTIANIKTAYENLTN